MNVLIATETYLPVVSGVAIFSNNLATELVKRGVRVAVFAPSENDRYSYQIVDGIHLYRFPSLPNPFRKHSRLVVRQDRRVSKAFREFLPDLVHLQTPTGVSFSVYRRARRHNIPIIVTHHFSVDFLLSYTGPLTILSPVTKRVLVRYVNRFYKHCDYITCPTETVRKQLLSQRVKTPIRVISNGLRLEQFELLTTPPSAAYLRFRLPADKPLVLYVGRMDQDKNVPMMLHAIPEVIRKTNAHFVFVGNGNRLASYRQWVRRHGLQGHITFCGKLGPGSDLLTEFYLRSDIFILSCQIETQSLVTMEAMAARLPVVASRGGAIPELVENGRNGYLVEPDDSGEMAQRIISLVENPQLRKEMGELGRVKIAAHRLEDSIDKYMELYKSVLP